MRAHGHQVAALLPHPLDNFVHRFAIGQLGFGGNAAVLKLRSDLFQIGGVFGDFGTDRVRAVSSGSPSIGYVQQYQTAACQQRELLDVLDDRAVGGSAIQRHQNGLVHWLFRFSFSRHYPPVMTCHAALSESGKPYRSMAVIRMALAQPAISKNHPFFHAPMRLRELVKWSSGNMAKGSCKASTTWLSVSRSVTLLSPRTPIINTAGKMASDRVMSRRTQGLIRQCMKPSITTCPAKVPVMVLLCPLASSATANKVLAAAVPNKGASV